jgi:hypothetical protein
MVSDPLAERIALLDAPQDTTRNAEGAADHDEHAEGGDPGPSAAGASPPEDLAEVEAFLLDGLMAGIEWVYESRGAVAGPHWPLTPPETDTIRKPAARVVAKWAPKILAYVPSFALLWKDEITLCMVLLTVTRGRVMVDRQLAAEAAKATEEKKRDADRKRTEG